MKSLKPPKKLKNQSRPLVRPSSVNCCQDFWNLSHETVPLRRWLLPGFSILNSTVLMMLRVLFKLSKGCGYICVNFTSICVTLGMHYYMAKMFHKKEERNVYGKCIYVYLNSLNLGGGEGGEAFPCQLSTWDWYWENPNLALSPHQGMGRGIVTTKILQLARFPLLASFGFLVFYPGDLYRKITNIFSRYLVYG
jgi:hypothetical protein